MCDPALVEKNDALAVFKGGTSLSKAFGIIRSFSDMSICPSTAPISATRVIATRKSKGISRKRAGQLADDLVGDVEKHIADRQLPALRSAIGPRLGERRHGEWPLAIDEADAQTVNFNYRPRFQRLNTKAWPTSRCG